MKFSIGLFLFILVLQINCQIRSVDYALEQVRLSEKTKLIVDEQPAIRFNVTNVGQDDVWDVIITVKAKRRQVDISVQQARHELLRASESITQTLIFKNLKDHEDYDLITYAVNFTKP